MDGIVNDDSAGEGEKTIYHYPQHYLPGGHTMPKEPWRYSQGIVYHNGQNSSPIGLISEHEKINEP